MRQPQTEAGAASLGDLFAKRSQVLVYHFMFGPAYTSGCPSCFGDRRARHRAAYTRRMGWTFRWASSPDSGFNFDFNTSFSETSNAREPSTTTTARGTRHGSYARGLDALWGMYQWLDRAPLGRNETGPWWRPHDEYR